MGLRDSWCGLLLGAFIIALVYEIGFSGSVDDVNDVLVGIMAIPVGILVCWGFYKGLQANWSKPRRRFESEEILDADLPGEENQS